MSKHRRQHRQGRRHAAAGRTAPRVVRRATAPVLAVAIASAVLPWGSSATAGQPPVAQQEPERAFSGYRAAATASPVTLELYESSIPIPSSPQVEMRLGYTRVEGDSGSSQARSAYLWPGDPVGEGFKTFADQLGFPPQVGEQGYPFQVNASQPEGEVAQRDEPFPGMIQRAAAGEGTARAATGFSPDGTPQRDDEPSGDDGDGGSGGSDSGALALPGLPALTGAALLGSLGGAQAAEDDEDDEGGSGLPPEVAALVDLEGFTTVSSLDSGNRVAARSRATLGGISLLGGLITSRGLTTEAASSSDGTEPLAEGRTTYGDLVVLGQRFRHGPDGFEAAGRPTPIPGLPDDAGTALQQLGVVVSLPPPTYERVGDEAVAVVSGLVLDVDLVTLKRNLAGVPLGDLIGAVPDEAGELKDMLGLVAAFSPRVVITLGSARSAVETSAPVEPVDAPEETEEETDAEQEAAAPSGGAATGGLGGTPGSSAGGAAPDTGAAPGAATGDLGDSTPVAASPGLPPLFSIPGLLLMGALALAALGGSYVRKLGVLALGGGAPCAHGLDSGLPDLRKA